MKSIRYFIFFIKQSQKYLNNTIPYLLFHEHLIKRAIWYVKTMNKADKILKEYGIDKATYIADRQIEL